MQTGLKRAKEVLPSNQECWQAFLDSGVTGIAIADFSGRYITTNPAFRKMLGYQEPEIHDMLLSDFTDDKDSRNNHFAELVTREEGHVKIEKHHRRNDDSCIWLKADLVVIPRTQSTTRFVIALVEDISEAKHAQSQAVDVERRRLAEQLHNITGQNILALIMSLDRIKRDMEVLNPKVYTVLCECAALARQSLREIRTFSYLLHPPLFDELGFVGAMRTFAHMFAERSEMKVEVDMPDSYPKLPSEVEVTLFRVAQEGMINAHRHATGSGVTIRMRVDGTVVRLSVENEGALSPSLNENDCSLAKVGVGISGIRERVQHFGGRLLLRSDQNRTFLEAAIPLPNAPELVTPVENAIGHPRTPEPGKGPAEAVPCPEQEVRRKQAFSTIVGNSPSLERVFKQIETVAPTDSSVLIVGETGTGKELIATAIHVLSLRHDNRFVTSNCASVPAGLLESELFGHEKGAFTGAVTLVIGRVELANRGTLFLDEVGDIPLELQSKLLRMLQQREFERLGSARAIHVDFRLVTATNRDLMQMVEDGRFRSDLYYRLNVFPIEVPPLRDRPKDIPRLAWHFVKTYARRMNKRIERIRSEDMEALINFHWPGNVRELQNVMERAVIMSPNKILHCPVLGSQMAQPKRDDGTSLHEARTLAEADREHILRTLKHTDWIIGGPYGAAVRLGVRRTTLLYRIHLLGISRPT
jgi:formate hydrogenlyase transcriptional activator